MKRKLLLLFAVVISVLHLNAQASKWYFSPITCTVKSKSDSAFLINHEVRMWESAKNGKVHFYDNPAIDCQFKVKMTRAEMLYLFEDDSITANNASRFFGMVLMENMNADSLYVMQFVPMYRHTFRNNSDRWSQVITFEEDSTGEDINARMFHVAPQHSIASLSMIYSCPLSDLKTIFPAKTIDTLAGIYRSNLAKKIHAQIKGDSLFRFARYTCDSNEYLPQASYQHLITTITNDIYAGKIACYSDQNFGSRMTKNQINNSFVSWDSTNQVEDPNNPGTFFLAPIKFEGQPKSFIIYEKWIPISPEIKKDNSYNWPPDGFIAYKRIVVAYGLNLTNGNTLWLSSSDVNAQLRKDNFDFAPYEESFRAERWNTLKVQIQ